MISCRLYFWSCQNKAIKNEQLFAVHKFGQLKKRSIIFVSEKERWGRKARWHMLDHTTKYMRNVCGQYVH